MYADRASYLLAIYVLINHHAGRNYGKMRIIFASPVSRVALLVGMESIVIPA